MVISMLKINRKPFFMKKKSQTNLAKKIENTYKILINRGLPQGTTLGPQLCIRSNFFVQNIVKIL